LFFEAPKFTGTNYDGWARMMRLHLRYYKLWDVVVTPIPGMARSVINAFTSTGDAAGEWTDAACVDPKILGKCERAYFILVLAIESEEASALIRDVPDDNAHEVWRRLEGHYNQRNAYSSRNSDPAASMSRSATSSDAEEWSCWSNDDWLDELRNLVCTDYGAWASRMRALLRSYNLWDIVVAPLPGVTRAMSGFGEVRSDPPVDDAITRKCEQAFFMILRCIKSGTAVHLYHDLSDDDAHELWRRVQEHYEKHNDATTMSHSSATATGRKETMKERIKRQKAELRGKETEASK
jgi:hypothetical protein